MTMNRTARKTLNLSDAQISALECAGLDDPRAVDGYLRIVRACWRANRLVLPRSAKGRDRLASAICELSNGEDETAQHSSDREVARCCRAAARALATLQGRVLRARF